MSFSKKFVSKKVSKKFVSKKVIQGLKNCGRRLKKVKEARGLRNLGQPSTWSEARDLRNLGQPTTSSDARGLRDGRLFKIS